MIRQFHSIEPYSCDILFFIRYPHMTRRHRQPPFFVPSLDSA